MTLCTISYQLLKQRFFKIYRLSLSAEPLLLNMLHFCCVRKVALRIFLKNKYIYCYYYYYYYYYYFHKVCQPSQGRGTRLRTGHQSHLGGGQARLYQRLVQGSTQNIHRTSELSWGWTGSTIPKVSPGFHSRILTGYHSHQAQLYQKLVQGSTQKYAQDIRDILGMERVDCTKS